MLRLYKTFLTKILFFRKKFSRFFTISISISMYFFFFLSQEFRSEVPNF